MVDTSGLGDANNRECFFFRLTLLKASASIFRKAFENELQKAWKSFFPPLSKEEEDLSYLQADSPSGQGSKHDIVTGKSVGFVVLLLFIPGKRSSKI